MLQTKNGMGVLPDLQGAVCLASTANSQVGATVNTAITYAAATVTGAHLSPGKLLVSYDADPTGGKLEVTNYAGSNVYASVDVTKSGPAPIDLSHVWLPIGVGMKVTLAAGGASAKGKVNCYHLTQTVGV